MPNNTNKVSVSLYNGKVDIDFYPDSHRYKKPTEKSYLISATAATGVLDKSRWFVPWAVSTDFTYLKQYLDKVGATVSAAELAPIIEEAQKQHDIKKKVAGDIGSKTHEWIEKFIKSQIEGSEFRELPEDEKVMNAVNGFLDWFNGHNVTFTASERLIYSQDYDYCGLTDFTAIVDGKHTVGDFKTGKNIYTEHYYQLSAYWAAIEEEDKKKFDQGIILHVNKETGAFNAQQMSKKDNQLNFPVFLACLQIKRREKELAIW